MPPNKTFGGVMTYTDMPSSSSIQTVTVGTGIQPVQQKKPFARGLYRRWGFSPRPEDLIV
jgi:hypothetical protein